MSDTTEAAARAQIAVYRRLAGSARLRLAFEMSTLARELAATRLRREHPDWSPDRLSRELLRYSLLPAPLPLPLE
jgi:Rv0078B-related antitoxin